MRGLVDAEVQAEEDVEFSCEVSRAGATDVQWRLQGLPLQSNEVTEVAVRDGCTHTLQLKGVTLEDAGTVSFHVGSHTSSAQLTVRGSQLWGACPLTAPGMMSWPSLCGGQSWTAGIPAFRSWVLAGGTMNWQFLVAPVRMEWFWAEGKSGWWAGSGGLPGAHHLGAHFPAPGLHEGPLQTVAPACSHLGTSLGQSPG